MAKHAKHGTPEETKLAKKNLKKRKKKLKHERKQEQKNQRKREKGGHGCLKAFLIVLLIAILLAIAAAAALIVRPSFAEPVLEAVQPAVEQAENAIDQALALGGFGPLFANGENEDRGSSPATEAETSPTMEASDNAAPPEPEPEPGEKCYLIAQCQDVDIYSPIMQKDITGVLFHQASYEWAQVMTSELPSADLEKMYNDGTYLRVNHEQTEGEWADADIAHLYRETDDTPMDTSIDCGAKAGTTVYAPVTGKVVAVMDYDLYDEIPDVQIHIRPDANKDLDVVLLHQYDPQVKVGDHVTAGETPLSSVRDIAKDLTDVQLYFYTEPDDPGNHSHVQVNDFNDKEYLKKYFDGKRPDK